MSLRQYDLHVSLQRVVAEGSVVQQLEGQAGVSTDLAYAYSAESDTLSNNQPTDKNLIEDKHIYSYGLIGNSSGFMTYIDSAYQASVQRYLKEKQAKFDVFMKKM